VAAARGSAALAVAGGPRPAGGVDERGLALGRTLWRAAAGFIPLYYEPPVARWALLAITPAALGCTLLVALLPAARAARLPAGPLLRGE
jgi:hypothetical protein